MPNMQKKHDRIEEGYIHGAGKLASHRPVAENNKSPSPPEIICEDTDD